MFQSVFNLSVEKNPLNLSPFIQHFTVSSPLPPPFSQNRITEDEILRFTEDDQTRITE